ncbi:MAG: 1-deoxy-D-xylulose-5-phosphate reductoisomerase [Planctomycetota bacterium]
MSPELTPSAPKRPSAVPKDASSIPDASDTTAAAATEAPIGSTGTTRRIAVLGASGSIGTATADVIEHLDRVDSDTTWCLHAASAHRNVAMLRQIHDRFDRKPRLAISDPASLDQWRGDARSGELDARSGELGVGPDALVELATDPDVDTVVAAIVGAAGLESSLAALNSGKRVALANKETLVVAGPLVLQSLRERGGRLLPVDSEHSAIFQALGAPDAPCHEAATQARKIILTASGGPFRQWTLQQMRDATPQQAMRHPTWDMGAKITIDSATMMNKALEIIEARWLFDLPADRIEVMVHPQSIIHSMIECMDGSLIAQMGPPDMKLPIQLALTHPRRLPGITPTLDRSQCYDLNLSVADRERFPALDLGFEVAAAGGTAGVVLNAANERAVECFIAGKIRFTEIVSGTRKVLEMHDFESRPGLSRLRELDAWSRREFDRVAGVEK